MAHGLMEATLTRENLRRAVRQVRANKGAPGIDGMGTEELLPYLKAHWATMEARLREGSYQPQPVRRVEIPKPDGGVRQLGIPTVLDRLIQQALLQVLTPLYDPTFSPHSYGFRPGRSAHQAIRAARAFAAAGRTWVVDLDLERFFDRVNHDKLMSLLAQRIGDPRVLKLIRAYLRAGVMLDGVVVPRGEGTPQGGPLSPLLANILLHELDRELERRGHAFCRYADDCNVYVQSARAGTRVMASLTRFLEQKLKLRVNRAKSGVGRPWERPFLGLRLRNEPTFRISLAPETRQRCQRTIRDLTARNRGRSLSQVIAELNRYTRGWVNYFAIAQTGSVFRDLNSWVRRRLRCYVWKQWKTTAARRRHLRHAGTPPALAIALTSRRGCGPWRVSRHAEVQRALSNAYLQAQGYLDLYQQYRACQTA